MTKKFVGLFFLLGLGAFVVSCATSKPPSTAFTSKGFSAVSIDTSDRTQKVDNFIVILDASGSMAETFKGEQKFVQAKEIVSRLNQTIPDLPLNGALRTLDGKDVGEPYGLTSYSKSELAQALAAQQGGEGSTPIARAFDNANSDLASTQGQTAVFFVSDGVNTDDAPIAAIAKLKEQYGDRLCIYPVRIGKDPTGQAVMLGAARSGQCGFAVNADSIASSQGMANYVERVFLAEKAMAMEAKIGDADGDGVLDNVDNCPNVPGKDPFGCPMAPNDGDNDGIADASDQCPDTPNMKVNALGCPFDTDDDGVADNKDQCPRTPKGAEVNIKGCWVLANLQFDTDKSQIKAKHYGVLERAYRVLAQNPNLRIEVQGHTDSVGTADYNQALSQRRAISVKQHLVEKGIAASRLSASGFGLTQPADSNATGDGRARNRRVQLEPLR